MILTSRYEHLKYYCGSGNVSTLVYNYTKKKKSNRATLLRPFLKHAKWYWAFHLGWVAQVISTTFAWILDFLFFSSLSLVLEKLCLVTSLVCWKLFVQSKLQVCSVMLGSGNSSGSSGTSNGSGGSSSSSSSSRLALELHQLRLPFPPRCFAPAISLAWFVNASSATSEQAKSYLEIQLGFWGIHY